MGVRVSESENNWQECGCNAFAGAGSTIASSSSDEDTVRFLPLAAGGEVTWGLEGDFFDDASANEEGRGRADETR